MPQQERVTERYWCPGPWPWQWFDTCTRTVTKWCYDFSWVEETGYGFISNDKGCENGILYSWWTFSFLIFGSTYYGPGRMCFDSLLSSSGRCAGNSVEGIAFKGTANAPHLQEAARRRVHFGTHHEDVMRQPSEQTTRHNESEGQPEDR